MQVMLMNEIDYLKLPKVLELIEAETKALGFTMGSLPLTGAFLRVLAASKPGANVLELGTGTGLSAAWMLDGMDADSSLATVDNNATYVEIAQRHLGSDSRVTFFVEDGSEFLVNNQGKQFDLIFADAWTGKFSDLDLALALLNRGGYYVIDDLLPQPLWTENHAPKFQSLLQLLAQRDNLIPCPLAWSSGLLVAVKNA
jgi:predicted O-methyltransferase YrrM